MLQVGVIEPQGKGEAFSTNVSGFRLCVMHHGSHWLVIKDGQGLFNNSGCANILTAALGIKTSNTSVAGV